MSRLSYGQRVIVVRNIDADSIYEIAPGIFIGEEIPSEECAGLGRFFRETGKTSPTVRLDTGTAVYGCEFLIYPLDEILDLTSRTRVRVSLDEARASQRLGEVKKVTIDASSLLPAAQRGQKLLQKLFR